MLSAMYYVLCAKCYVLRDSRKSQVARNVTFGDGSGQWAVGNGRVFDAVIGILVYWCIGGRALALHFTGMDSRLQTNALQCNTPKFLIQIFHLNKSAVKQRIPKPFTIHPSPFTIHHPTSNIRKRSFRLGGGK